MKRLIFISIFVFLVFSPLIGDYYSYKKGNWRDFYGFHGWKSIYKYEGWRSVYKYESWRDVYGYYGWRETYLERGKSSIRAQRLRKYYMRDGQIVPILFFRGFIFCIR